MVGEKQKNQNYILPPVYDLDNNKSIQISHSLYLFYRVAAFPSLFAKLDGWVHHEATIPAEEDQQSLEPRIFI